MHVKYNVLLSSNIFGPGVPDVASFTVFTYLHVLLH